MLFRIKGVAPEFDFTHLHLDQIQCREEAGQGCEAGTSHLVSRTDPYRDLPVLLAVLVLVSDCSET